jgi:aryl-alcohol dehydrogenase-like predicted oxidoreductase
MGKCERILAEALGDERADVIVASKIFLIAPFPAVIRQREKSSAGRLQLKKNPPYQVHLANPVIRIR